MEVSSGYCVLEAAAIFIFFVWIVPNWLWFVPSKKDKHLISDQSLDDRSYRCISGDTKEISEAKSKAISRTRDIAPRVPPFFYRSVATHECQVGDKVMLKASSWKGIVRFENDGKFSPYFLGPFKVLERIGSQTYKLDLPPEMHDIHDIFHVGYLYKCMAHKQNVIPSSNSPIDDEARGIEEPEVILDTKIKRLRNKQIFLVKVQWSHRRGVDVTWESKEDMQKRYPHLFA